MLLLLIHRELCKININLYLSGHLQYLFIFKYQVFLPRHAITIRMNDFPFLQVFKISIPDWLMKKQTSSRKTGVFLSRKSLASSTITGSSVSSSRTWRVCREKMIWSYHLTSNTFSLDFLGVNVHFSFFSDYENDTHALLENTNNTD